MINAAEAIVGGSMWASMTSCLTPTVLFCILNLTVVTIFITSSLEKPHELGDDEDESPPKLIRVKSINFSTYSSEQPYPFDSAASHATAPPQEPTHLQKSECVEESHVNRSRSDTSVNVPERRVLKKSASEKVFAAERQEEEDRLRPIEEESYEMKEMIHSSKNVVHPDINTAWFINRICQHQTEYPSSLNYS